MSTANPAQQNHLLDALPPEQYARLLPHLELVSMPVGQVVNKSGGLNRHVYFPTTAILSRLCLMASGETTEVTMVGNEGVIGFGLFMGGESATIRTVVQHAGNVYRLKDDILIQEFSRCGELQRLLLLYTQAMMTQVGQTSMCYRHHSLDQQLCRWLMHTLDRSNSFDLALTQEQIANMLGVRREGITEAVGNLRRAGLIETHRGHIEVLDRAGLEERSCECYAVVRKEFDRLLPRAAAVPYRWSDAIGHLPAHRPQVLSGRLAASQA